MIDKPLLRALKRQPVERPPFWFMRQAGRYMPEYRAVRADAGGFLDLCFNADKAVEVTKQPLRAFGMDAAILFSDILVVPLGLGQKVWFEEGEGPRLEPIASVDDLEAYDASALKQRLSVIFDVVARLSKDLADEFENTALIGFAGAPWTVATYMVEGRSSRNYENVKQWAYGDPAGFGRLIDRLVEATIDYLSAQIEAGAEAVQLFDSWAGALDEAGQERWSFAPMAEIAQSLKQRYPKVPIIAFARQVGCNTLKLAKMGCFDALSLDHTVSLSFAREQLQPHVCLQGNLDPLMVVTGGDAMLRAADEIREAWRDGPFIFNLSHGLIPPTPVAHVDQLSRRLLQA